jgi:D-3-phosphoglycerate dehydrogenase
MKILITCPPLLQALDRYRAVFAQHGMEIIAPQVVQVMSEDQLLGLVPEADGWIIGDDPVNARVLAAGKAGRLKAAVRWGVGVDNVDFAACRALGIPIANTPGMFGREVADVAIGYVVALARETMRIHREVGAGGWPKPIGISLAGKNVALIGFGDIGRNIARRLLAMEMKVIAYDPLYQAVPGLEAVERAEWPLRISEADFLIFACSLNPANRHMLNAEVLARTKCGVRVVNVARGPLIDEMALVSALASGHVHSAALDVLEEEPLAPASGLRQFGDRCLFGSHNSSNTVEAVERTSLRAVELLADFLQTR